MGGLRKWHSGRRQQQHSALIEIEAAGWRASPFAFGGGKGMAPALPAQIDPSFTPVPLGRSDGARRGMQMESGQAATSVVRVVCGSPDEVRALARHEGRNGIIRVWSDPVVAPFPAPPVDCAVRSTGSAAEVAQALGMNPGPGKQGAGVVIGIVDGGVDRQRHPVVGGWSPDPHAPWGVASEWDGHGNMCAFDSLIAAPKATLYDLGIAKLHTGALPTVAAALQAYEWALNRYRADGTPQVLSNSWGLYQDSWDPFPRGDPRNYTHNPQHPLMRKALELMDAGIILVFAAGNCGRDCADGRCGADVGSGRSIRGLNGHQRTICVGAVNLRRERAGYSSQGPSTLDPQKPDICGYTHFTGETDCDSGTSAACPVVAGVVAALRSAQPTLRQDTARLLLRNTATPVGAGGFNVDTGAGIVNGAAALKKLAPPPGPAKPPRRRAAAAGVGRKRAPKQRQARPS